MEKRQRIRVDDAHPRHILLVVDCGCQWGETLRIVPYVTAVRDRYPDAHITLLVNEDARAAFPDPRVFDRIVISRLFLHRPYSRFGVYFSVAREYCRLVWQLGIQYDLIITYYWGARVQYLLGYVVGRFGRSQRVGYSEKPTRLLSTQLGPFNDDAPQAQQNVALLHAAGIDIDGIAAPSIRYTMDDDAVVSRLLHGCGVESSTRLVVLHPGSDWACQQWLPERWAVLADELVTRFNADIVFTGTSSEVRHIEHIRQCTNRPTVSLAGQTTLPQVASLLARSCLCICVDSAIFELTQATGTPAVVLAGSTQPETVASGRHSPVVVRRMEAGLAEAVKRCKRVSGPIRPERVASEGYLPVAVSRMERRFAGLASLAGSAKVVEACMRMQVGDGCLNYQCCWAGLRDIMVTDVLEAVERQAQVSGLSVREQARSENRHEDDVP